MFNNHSGEIGISTVPLGEMINGVENHNINGKTWMSLKVSLVGLK
jgi:hypothetical protein